MSKLKYLRMPFSGAWGGWIATTVLVTRMQLTGVASPYASTVVDSRILPGHVGNSHTNVLEALGAPNSDATHWRYVSLGGPGAWITLDMGEQTPIVDGPGPDVEVREIGTGFGGVDEGFVLWISNSPESNSFVRVGTGIAISLFDISGSGLTTARYVRLVDVATESLDTETPGSDIDSVTSLHSANVPLAPENLAADFTGQGILLSWSQTASDEAYLVRRSFSGISFPSLPDATLLSPEHAYHDTAPLDVADLWYSITAVRGGTESAQAVVHLPSYCLTVDASGPFHLGDDTVPGWEPASPTNGIALSFALANDPQGPFGKLVMDVFNVDYAQSPILVNGAKVGQVPLSTPSSWVTQAVSFAVGPVHRGTNMIQVFARDSVGSTSGGLDDFMIRNIRLALYGDTNFVTLPWVVGHTPTLTPPTWMQISEPIRWTDVPTNRAGFFRLQLP